MAGLPTLDAKDSALLCERLEAIGGVVRAIVDAETDVIWLIAQPSTERHPLEAAAAEVMRSIGVDTSSIRLRVATDPDSGPRRRVRFEKIERTLQSSGMSRLRVTLEWMGRFYTGEAWGETGDAVELRTAAAATIAAVNSVLGGDKGFRLIGVKSLRAFDADMVVVSIQCADPEPRHYVGAVMADPDPLHGAARAVLHALNRVIGNFLLTSD